jgi:DNA invertase Pin-like site-specific DNA recombinase
MASAASSQRPRAIGIVRVSQRDDDSGHSPEVQARAMLRQAADEGFDLAAADIWDENVDRNGKVRKVSGGAALADRPKLRAAVEAVERGEASVIVAERFDRLFRDLDVQREVIRRVESAGGRLVTAAGKVSHATAEAELHANLNGAIAQYTKRTAMERSWDAVEIAIEEGRVPWKDTTPGYDLIDGRLVPNKQAPVVEQAFRLRATGAPIKQVRAYLREHGIKRSFHGTTHLLASRLVLGEIHFGKHTPNVAAHPAIVDPGLWRRAQDVRAPRGRRAKSDRLLARAGILRCGSCGARMVVGTANRSRYFVYRCPPTSDCTQRVTVSAERVEQYVERVFLAGMRRITARGTRPPQELAESAEQAARAQAELEALIDMLDPLEPAARKRLVAATEKRDRARAALQQARGLAEVSDELLSVDLEQDWHTMRVEDRRRLLTAGLDRVLVAPGRRSIEERAEVHWRGES